jgi:hypothetical protein
MSTTKNISIDDPQIASYWQQFWETYPRKVAKQYAYRCFLRALKRGASPEEIISAAERYAELCSLERREKRYIMHPSTFLNDDRWESYLSGTETDELIEEARRRRDIEEAKVQAYGLWRRVETAIKRGDPAILSEEDRHIIREVYGGFGRLRTMLPDPEADIKGYAAVRSRLLAWYLDKRRSGKKARAEG